MDNAFFISRSSTGEDADFLPGTCSFRFPNLGEVLQIQAALISFLHRVAWLSLGRPEGAQRRAAAPSCQMNRLRWIGHLIRMSFFGGVQDMYNREDTPRQTQNPLGTPQDHLAHLAKPTVAKT